MHQPGAAAGEPAVQQPDLLGAAPRAAAPARAPPTWAPSATRRSPASGPPRGARRPRRRAGRGAGRPPPSHPRPSGRAPTSSGSAASAASRCARSSARMSPASRSRWRVGRLEALVPGGQRLAPRRRARRSAASSSPATSRASGGDGGAYSAGVCSPAHGRGAAAQLVQRARRDAEAPRAGMRCVHDRSGTASSIVSTAVTAACRGRNGPSAPSRGVATTDNRGNASAGGHHPPAAVGRAGSAGCSGAGARRSAAARGPRPPARGRRRRCRPARPARPCRAPVCRRSPAVK